MSDPGRYVGAESPPPWSMTADPQPRPAGGPRSDPLAFLLLILAGAAGIAQYLMAGYPVGRSDPLGGSVVTGRELLSELGPHVNSTASITRIALLVIVVGGAALVLLGLAALLPMSHGPVGLAALLIALAIGGAAAWIAVQSSRVLGSPVSALLAGGEIGWYLTVAAALIGMVGAFRALGT